MPVCEQRGVELVDEVGLFAGHMATEMEMGTGTGTEQQQQQQPQQQQQQQ